MSRYIDADVLEYDTEWSEYHDGFTAYSQMAIDTAPSIDIVRCKEYKWWVVAMDENNTDEDYLKCNMDKWTDADDFCSYGEREGE